MSQPLGNRIIGIETEFGTLVADESLPNPEAAVELIKDHVFYELRLGAIDRHCRDDIFEPAGSGGFLLNGARLYIDAVGSHLEYATAECLSLKDVVANDRAGHRLILRALQDLDLRDSISVYNNGVDHFGGHTFGCHENYSIAASDDFFQRSIHMLYPFLVTRQLFAGTGRVGGHILAGGHRPDYDEVLSNPVDYIWVSNVYGVYPDPNVQFQISQRADHILKTAASRVRFNRAIVNPKWEHYYSNRGLNTRLHVLFGEANQNELAFALKVGTTNLVLQLLELDLIPERLILANPVGALRGISRAVDMKYPVVLLDGSAMGCLDMQWEYLRLAQQEFRGASEDADWTLNEWEDVLKGLEKDPMTMGDRVDWVAKKQIVDQYREMEGLEWSDDALHSVDLEYHNIDPQQSLFHAWQKMGKSRRLLSEVDIVDAVAEAPKNTRAHGRAQLVQKVLKSKHPRGYHFDWSAVSIGNGAYYDLSDPFDPYDAAVPEKIME